MATMDELHSYDASARVAASSLPLHSAAILDNTGRLIERQNFEIPQVEESAPEETASENAMGE